MFTNAEGVFGWVGWANTKKQIEIFLVSYHLRKNTQVFLWIAMIKYKNYYLIDK